MANEWDPLDPWRGWAEFNDADAVIRGAIIGATGEFSGEFTADVVNAVRSANIRDGAVSTNLGFQIEGGFQKGLREATFTVPGQSFGQAINIVLPLFCEKTRGGGTSCNIYAYRDEVLISHTLWNPSVDNYPNPYHRNAWYASLRLLDLNVGASGTPIAYRFLIVDGPGSIELRAHIIGSAYVSCRKR